MLEKKLLSHSLQYMQMTDMSFFLKTEFKVRGMEEDTSLLKKIERRKLVKTDDAEVRVFSFVLFFMIRAQVLLPFHL